MKKIISDIYDGIMGSLNGKPLIGFSARKVCAFVITIMVIVTHIKWFRSNHWEYLSIVLGFDYTFILCCLGLATWQYITDKKINKNDPTAV